LKNGRPEFAGLNRVSRFNAFLLKFAKPLGRIV
jgi:hypothetical protein